MKYFRKFLTFLRKGQNTQGMRFFYLWGSILLGSMIAAVLVDVLLPFGAWWNLIRTLVLVPLSVSMFAVGYGVGLILHRIRNRNPEWKPYRTRFSPLWRMRISAIAAAIGLVLVYASGESPVYTIFSGFLLALGLGLLAFMRRTTQEMKRENLGIPDARDVSYDAEMRRLQDSRKKIMADRAAKREAKREGKKRFRAFRPLDAERPEDQS